jgi:hypothetical protein
MDFRDELLARGRELEWHPPHMRTRRVKLHVLTGEADVVLGTTTTVPITDGVTGKVRDNGDGTFAVDHIDGGAITPAGTTSLSEGQLPSLDVTPPQLTVPAPTVNLRPTGPTASSTGPAAGYPGEMLDEVDASETGYGDRSRHTGPPAVEIAGAAAGSAARVAGEDSAAERVAAIADVAAGTRNTVS